MVAKFFLTNLFPAQCPFRKLLCETAVLHIFLFLNFLKYHDFIKFCVLLIQIYVTKIFMHTYRHTFAGYILYGLIGCITKNAKYNLKFIVQSFKKNR